jgi:hypothetical protein
MAVRLPKVIEHPTEVPIAKKRCPERLAVMAFGKV